MFCQGFLSQNGVFVTVCHGLFWGKMSFFMKSRIFVWKKWEIRVCY